MNDATLVSTLPEFTTFVGEPLTDDLYRARRWELIGQAHHEEMRHNPRLSYNGRMSRMANWTNVAHAIWQEAVIENAHRDALQIENYRTTGAHITLTATIEPLTVERDEQNREAQANALAVMRSREERTLRDLATAQAELERLRAPITEGSDERLKDFWRQAAQIATSEGFCPEYDRLAARMGGLRRDEMTARYEVDVELEFRFTRSVSVSVIATSESSAMRQVLAENDHSELFEYVDLTGVSHYDINSATAEDANLSDDQDDIDD